MIGETAGCRILRNVRIPARDGAMLATTVFLPPRRGRYPAVLVRTAYNRMNCGNPRRFTDRGMAYAVQDCRGRYASDGAWYPFVNEAADGAATLDWIAAQPWCDGRIGMFGASYLAATQFAVAPLGHRRLACLSPQFMTGDCWERAYYSGGAFSLGLTWSWLCFEVNARTSEAALMPSFDVARILGTLPIRSLDEASGAGTVPAYRDFVGHFRYDAFWRRLSTRGQCRRYTAPVLLTAGWYDYYPAEAVRMFAELRAAPSGPLREKHRLLIGPWTHGVGPRRLGELNFGPRAEAENDASDRWLDCILHGGDPAAFQEAPIRIFVMGANVWRDEREWPPPGTRTVAYFLRAGGRLATAPPGDERPDGYTYDPANPVPTVGGNHSIGPYNPGLYEMAKPGPYDQREIEKREDVLVYTSAPLSRDTEVTGPVSLELYAASSARDTDFVARLADVHPDGRSINITEGIVRARFRRSAKRPALIKPGTVYRYEVDMQVTSNVFKRGHRIRLDLTSSSFPLWDRNLNTGRNPATDTTMVGARQTVHHDSARPSRLLLPVAGGPANRPRVG